MPFGRCCRCCCCCWPVTGARLLDMSKHSREYRVGRRRKHNWIWSWDMMHSFRPCPSVRVRPRENPKRGGDEMEGRHRLHVYNTSRFVCYMWAGRPAGSRESYIECSPPPWHIYIIVGSIVIGKKENIYEERRGGAGVWALWLGHQLRPPISLSLSQLTYNLFSLSLSLI